MKINEKTRAKYLQFMKLVKMNIDMNPCFTMSVLCKSTGVDAGLPGVMRDLGIVKNTGTRKSPHNIWLAGEPEDCLDQLCNEVWTRRAVSEEKKNKNNIPQLELPEITSKSESTLPAILPDIAASNDQVIDLLQQINNRLERLCELWGETA